VLNSTLGILITLELKIRHIAKPQNVSSKATTEIRETKSQKNIKLISLIKIGQTFKFITSHFNNKQNLKKIK